LKNIFPNRMINRKRNQNRTPRTYSTKIRKKRIQIRIFKKKSRNQIVLENISKINTKLRHRTHLNENRRIKRNKLIVQQPKRRKRRLIKRKKKKPIQYILRQKKTPISLKHDAAFSDEHPY